MLMSFASRLSTFEAGGNQFRDKAKFVERGLPVFATCSMCARVQKNSKKIQRTFSMYGCDGRILNRLTAKTIVAGIMIPASAHAALKPSVAV